MAGNVFNMKLFFLVRHRALIISIILIIIASGDDFGVEASRLTKGHVSCSRRRAKLFVFGDSYADTGNGEASQASSWKVPYGVTFPGRPAGRFSNGRVFTDLLAKHLGLKTPVAYQRRKKVLVVAAAARKKYGMNFATGGTGVFDTVQVPGPNMTTQIDQFEQLIKKEKVYRNKDIESSVALVAISGNDYASYLLTNRPISVLPEFTTQVVNQVALNLKRVHELGVKKVAVMALPPLGCLPGIITYFTNSQQCITFINQLVALHNQQLEEAVAKFNNETEPSTFVIIDLYTAFTSVIDNKENPKFETPLVPCCEGVNANYSCGSVDDETGEKKYTVCPNPSSAFFWDLAHPTQEGWRAVFSKLHLDELV